MGVWMVIGIVGAVALAAAAQQLVGFGFALVAMPLLSALVGPRDAVAVEAVASLAGGAAMAWSLRDRVAWVPLRRLLAGAVFGLPLGALALGHVPETPLQVAVAVAVVAMVVVLAAGVRMAAESPRTEVGAGFVSGAMGASIGISGPPVVLVLQAARMEQHRFRATTVSFFVLTNLAIVPLLLGTGVADVDRWPAAVVAVPAALIGNRACRGVASRVPPAHFRALVLGLMVAAAAVALVTAV